MPHTRQQLANLEIFTSRLKPPREHGLVVKSAVSGSRLPELTTASLSLHVWLWTNHLTFLASFAPRSNSTYRMRRG